MGFGDQQFDCKREFSIELMSQLRKVASHKDAFDPEDMGIIFDIQYLMMVFDRLNKHDLIRGAPKVAEAEEWLAKFKSNFEAWESFEDYPNLLKAFEDFVLVCQDNN